MDCKSLSPFSPLFHIRFTSKSCILRVVICADILIIAAPASLASNALTAAAKRLAQGRRVNGRIGRIPRGDTICSSQAGKVFVDLVSDGSWLIGIILESLGLSLL